MLAVCDIVAEPLYTNDLGPRVMAFSLQTTRHTPYDTLRPPIRDQTKIYAPGLHFCVFDAPSAWRTAIGKQRHMRLPSCRSDAVVSLQSPNSFERRICILHEDHVLDRRSGSHAPRSLATVAQNLTDDSRNPDRWISVQQSGSNDGNGCWYSRQPETPSRFNGRH